jgi:hypothetical protein
MHITSTLGFAVATPAGQIPASTFTIAPSVAPDGTVTGLPVPQDGVLLLVNARVFGASDRADLVQFDAAQTLRNPDNTASAQGGFIRRDGTTSPFEAGMF